MIRVLLLAPAAIALATAGLACDTRLRDMPAMLESLEAELADDEGILDALDERIQDIRRDAFADCTATKLDERVARLADEVADVPVAEFVAVHDELFVCVYEKIDLARARLDDETNQLTRQRYLRALEQLNALETPIFEAGLRAASLQDHLGRAALELERVQSLCDAPGDL
jgi:hypothetical protein